MNKEIMSSSNYAFKIDPRTKILLLIMISTFVLGGLGDEKLSFCRIVFSILPLILLFLSKNYKSSLIYLLVYALGSFIQVYLCSITNGILNYILMACGGIMTRFVPSIMMGVFAVTTTKVSEFVAGMERLHITDKIIIPMSVMFRFFPTVREEFVAINEAMKMRGICFGKGKIMKMLEYRLIPMITCSVKIGEELSAASLTRGLGTEVKRTNICNIGFHIQDILIIIFSFVTVVFWIFYIVGIY